jgi:hypothetical protein
MLAGQFLQPTDQSRRAVQLPDRRRQLVDGMTTDATALFVPGQIVSIDRALECLDGGDELLRDLLR